MTSKEIGAVFLEDERSEIRKAGVHILADSTSERAEELLVQAMGDKSSGVRERACDAFRYRQPWLTLRPWVSAQKERVAALSLREINVLMAIFQTIMTLA